MLVNSAQFDTADGVRWVKLTLPPGGRRATPPPAFSAPADAGVQFTGLSFTDTSHGWALGHRCVRTACHSVLRRTTDGGTTWQVAPAPVAAYEDDAGAYTPWKVSWVAFADDRNGWLYGEDTLSTHDGGRTWKRLATGRLGSVSVAGGVVWAMEYEGCAGMLCFPTPARWPVGSDTVTHAPDEGTSAEGRLAAADGAHAYTVLGHESGPTVTATRDGGRTWATYPAPCRGGGDWMPAAFAPERLWVLCADGNGKHAVARSDDGGAHWHTEFATGLGTDGDVSLTAYSESVAWLLDRNAVRRTTDGGLTWSVAVQGASAASFADAEHGWALVNGVLWRTGDGVTWERLGRP